jgi:hypothetical protein
LHEICEEGIAEFEPAMFFLPHSVSLVGCVPEDFEEMRKAVNEIYKLDDNQNYQSSLVILRQKDGMPFIASRKEGYKKCTIQSSTIVPDSRAPRSSIFGFALYLIM